MTERLATRSARRPWRTLAIWAGLVIVSIGISGALLGTALAGDEDVTSDTESRRGYELQAQRLPDAGRSAEGDVSEVVVVRAAGLTVDDAAFRRHVRRTERAIEALGARATTALEADDPRLTSSDRRATALLVALGDAPEEQVERVAAVVERVGASGGFDAGITGEYTLDADFTALAEAYLRDGELKFGMPAALVVLLLVFGSVVAGLLPLLLALVSIVVALALLALAGQAFPLSVFSTNMLTAMGLALGIDYALFVLSRYREERSHGRSEPAAITAAGATASRAVLFSGVAFTLAMIGLLLVPSTVMRSLAAGAIAAGLVSVAVALTLLPAVLGLLGDRVNALRLPVFGRASGRRSDVRARRGGAQRRRGPRRAARPGPR